MENKSGKTDITAIIVLLMTAVMSVTFFFGLTIKGVSIAGMSVILGVISFSIDGSSEHPRLLIGQKEGIAWAL